MFVLSMRKLRVPLNQLLENVLCGTGPINVKNLLKRNLDVAQARKYGAPNMGQSHYYSCNDSWKTSLLTITLRRVPTSSIYCERNVS